MMFLFLHWMQNRTFKWHSFKQKHGVWWDVWNRTPVSSDLQHCWLRSPILETLQQVFQSIANTHENALKWTDFCMFSKSTPKHKVFQVHQGHDYTRTKPALELELIVPWQNQGRHSKGSEISVLAELYWADCLKACCSQALSVSFCYWTWNSL